MDRFTVRLSSAHKPSGNTKPLVFKNPILTASGTFGYGVEFANYGDLTHLGGIVVKGLSLKPRPGNPLPRVAETPCGMLNAVGLQNDGVESFLKNKLPRLPWHETPVIANLYATSPAEFAELAGILAAEEGIAVNISCPNVKNGGVLFGQDPALAAEVTEAVKKHAGNLPVIVKLSPNVTDITAIAKAAEQAGADAISCINTITKSMGAADFLLGVCESWMTPALFLSVAFIAGSVISFFTGSSWGTFAICIPIAVPMAYSFTGGQLGTLVYAAVGAVVSGGLFGDHCSPVSDTTVLSSLGAACDHIDHVRTQLPYALLAAAVSMILWVVVAMVGGAA